MPISCGNCGGAHDTVAEVRACHQVAPAPSGDASAPAGDSFDWADDPGPTFRSPDRPAPPKPTNPATAAPVHAGPAALGRTLVVRPGQDVPEAWATCPRVVLDDEALREPVAVVAQLGEWWTARRPYVVELAAALDRHPAETDDREPWRLDPSFAFPLERLAHLVWSNALDLRGDTPTNEAVTAAVAAGATVRTDGALADAARTTPDPSTISESSDEPVHAGGDEPVHAGGSAESVSGSPSTDAGHTAGSPTPATSPTAERGTNTSPEGTSEGSAFVERPSTGGAAPETVATARVDADGSTSADVRTPAGEAAWCDGGPLDLDLTGAAGGLPVLHRTWLEHGRVTPVANPAPTADLAADQLAAVTHRGGPCRVISPAGSGKTRTLTERARHLVAGCGLPPTALTLVAYNTRAAGEMRERLGELPGLQIRTLNSLGLAIVGGTGPFRRPGARPPRVLDEREVRDHLERLVKFPRRANTDPAALWIEALGQIRLGLRDPAEVEAEYQGDVDGFADVFPRYREALRRDGAVDFDEQIYQAVEVLLREPETRRAAQRTCRVMLVDEFQDLTPAHLLLIRLLAAPTYDVFGVGDDDQTIYGYQGADPRWLIDFAEYFPGAASHPLTVNYRCPPAVIGAARNLLTRNARRVPKTVEPAPGRPTDAGALRVVTAGAPASGSPGSPTGTGAVDRPGIEASRSVTAEDAATESRPLPARTTEDDPSATEASRSEPAGNAASGSAPRPFGTVEAARLPTGAPPETTGDAASPTPHPADRDAVDVELVTSVQAGTVGATVEAVGAHLDAGAAPSDVVVLARVNAALAPVQVALAVAGIPVDPVPGIRAWLQRTGVRSALAWLDLALDARRLSGAAIREAARRPPRGLSPKLIDWMSEQRDLGGLERLAGRVSRERDQEKLLAFIADVRLVAGVVDRGGDTAAVMATVRDRIGLGGAVESLDRSRGRVDRSTHGDDFDALHQLATLHPDPRTFRRWLTDQLNTEVPAGEGGRVHLSTVHRVKGLEWLHVVVHEVSNRLFPHRLVVGLDGREEERRIFHVAITRCSESVTVVAPADAPSPFLGELGEPGEPPPRPASAPAVARPAVGASSKGPKAPSEPVDMATWKQAQALHEALRQWRKARSTADGVPAYVVFADRTLDDLVARRPTTFPELLACHGIGPAKVENYGDELLAVIADFAG